MSRSNEKEPAAEPEVQTLAVTVSEKGNFREEEDDRILHKTQKTAGSGGNAWIYWGVIQSQNKQQSCVKGIQVEGGWHAHPRGRTFTL